MAEAGRDTCIPLAQLLSSRATQSGVLRPTARQLLDISREETAQLLGSLSHCSITHIAQKYFLVFRRNFCVAVCAPCLPSWHWALLLRAWLHPQSGSLKNKCKALAPCPQVQAVVSLLNL